MDCTELCTVDQKQQETLNPTESLPIPAFCTGVYNPTHYFTKLSHLNNFSYFISAVCLYVLSVSLWRPGCPGTCYIDLAGLKLRDLPVSAIIRSMCQHTQLARIQVYCMYACCPQSSEGDNRSSGTRVVEDYEQWEPNPGPWQNQQVL